MLNLAGFWLQGARIYPLVVPRRRRTDIKMMRVDPRELPAYTILEVAHYLAISPATVKYWAVGRGD